jgi:predicted nucleic-acid-binding protein
MKGVDTNVLVRFLVKDDAHQGKIASNFLQTGEAAVFINSIVLCELVWVLETAYGYEKPTILEVLTKILFTQQFEVEDRDLLLIALEDYSNTRADFSDCLIGHKNRLLGCEKTATFDRKLKGLETFELL